jgi:hypothetical protein
MAQMAGQALAGRKSPLPGAVPVAVTEGAAVLVAFVVVVVAAAALALVVQAARDAPLSDTLAGTDSALVVVAVAVDRMSGAALKPGPERVCPGPAPTLSVNHARSECSTWPGPDSGCHSMDNA